MQTEMRAGRVGLLPFMLEKGIEIGRGGAAVAYCVNHTESSQINADKSTCSEKGLFHNSLHAKKKKIDSERSSFSLDYAFMIVTKRRSTENLLRACHQQGVK